MSENVHPLFPDQAIAEATPETAAPALPFAPYLAQIGVALERVRKAAEDAVNVYRVVPMNTDTTLEMLHAIHGPLMEADRANAALRELLTCKGSA